MSSGGRIYFFKPLPIPPPYKQHWERKKEEEDMTQKEEAVKMAAREASVEFTKCSHSESMFDEGSGICMSCGVFLGTCFAPLSANTSGIPGAHHHAFSSAATSSATRKKKLQAANASAALSVITFNQTTTATATTSPSPQMMVVEDEKESQTPKEKTKKSSSLPTVVCENSCTTSSSTTSGAVFPLFYEGQKIVIFNGTIPIYTPPPFSFSKGKSLETAASSLSASDLKKQAFISYMHRISQEAFGKINNIGPHLTTASSYSSFSSFHEETSNGSVDLSSGGSGIGSGVYHPFDNIITTGIYSFTGYGFCRHSIGYVTNLKKKSQKFSTFDLNKEIIDAIPSIVEGDFEFYSSKRRRTQISLFVAIITAHIYIVHGKDTKSIQECLDIQRLRAKVKASLISKETQSSFYHAIGSRLGIDSKCSGRLVQDAYDMYILNLSKNSPEHA